MPNWCSNTIILYTEDKTHREVYKTIKDIKKLTDCKESKVPEFESEYFDFNKIIPVPVELMDGEQKPGEVFSDLEYADLLQAPENKNKNGEYVGHMYDYHCPVENHPGYIDNASINEWYIDMAKIHHDHSAYLKNKYGAYNAYDFRCSAWGTKWDGQELYVRKDAFTIALNFETAWSPPVPIYYKLCETIFKGYSSDFKFYEPGCGILGHLFYDKKSVRMNDHIFMDNDGAMNDESFKELTDFWGSEPDAYVKNKETGLWSYDPDYED